MQNSGRSRDLRGILSGLLALLRRNDIRSYRAECDLGMLAIDVPCLFSSSQDRFSNVYAPSCSIFRELGAQRFV